MINSNIIGALQAVNGITNSAILKYPTTILNNSAGDIVVKLDMGTLDSDEFPELGIYNLSEFISTFKLFPEYDCSITDGVVNINSDNNSVQYLTTSTNVLENFNKSEDLFTSTEKVPTVTDFTLTVADIKTIKSASAVFKDLSDIIIESQDGVVTIKLGSTNNFNAKSNSFSIRKTDVNTSKEYTVKIPAENFNSLPQSEYEFEIKYNAERDAFRIITKSTEIDMTILMAVKK